MLQQTCLIVLLVRKRIQCGIGRFCLAFLAKCFLILNVLYDGCGGAAMRCNVNVGET